MTGLGPARLILVRHAETEWNTARVFQGRLDSRLTATGLEQVRRLADRLEYETPIAAIYSSDQGRAMQTAELIASSLRLAVIPRADLREIDCGDWTGMSYDDVMLAWPDDHANWRGRPDLHCMPNGESVADVQRRALRFLEEVRRLHPGQTVCAVSHSTVVRSAVCYLLGLPLEKLWEGPRQPNCAVNLIELREDRGSITLVGDATHLEGLTLTAVNPAGPAGGAV